ncbi:MAG: hypothetical protein IT223_12905 [Crocinitomicaceae bacterium]|nr:hypothetical protein [Crocinitomicaceae bacterium]
MSEDAILHAEQLEIVLAENAKLKSEIAFLKRHILGKKSECFLVTEMG